MQSRPLESTYALVLFDALRVKICDEGLVRNKSVYLAIGDGATVRDVLQMALWRRLIPTGVIVHSDCGSQYCSAAYQTLIKQQGLLCRMSAKGCCYDNSCAEGFFHTLKVEAIHGELFATREVMRQTVFTYIELDYNRTRRHSANGYIIPRAFEALQVA